MKKYIVLTISMFVLSTSMQAQQFTTVDLFDMTDNVIAGNSGYIIKM